MKKLNRDLPIYVLSASLVFLGICISSNQATAAPSSATAADLARLQTQLTNFKRCANSNFQSISFWDASRGSRIMFVNTCQ